MDTQIEIGSGFTIIIADAVIDQARMRGMTLIPFPVEGVNWYPRTHSWRAYIRIAGKNKHLGYFKDKDHAIRARQRAESQLSSGSVDG